MDRLEKYVGRIIRLKEQACRRISGRKRVTAEHSDHSDNCFLVAAVNRKMRRLICYGGNCRIDVSPADVVLV